MKNGKKGVFFCYVSFSLLIVISGLFFAGVITNGYGLLNQKTVSYNSPLSASTLNTPSPKNQTEEPELGPEGCAGCGMCGGSIIILILIPVVYFVINILLLIWVAKDAKNRGMDNPVVWMFLVFFFGLIPFIIYFFARPSGNIVQCSHCGNKKLEAMKTCPHCQN